MTDDLRITLTADPGGGWTTLAFVGKYDDPGRYGRFEITPAMVESWQENLSAGVVTGEASRVAIDFDHSSEQSGSTLAAGWLTAIKLDGDRILGRVEWTEKARELIASGQYAYLSPTFASSFKTDQGRNVGATLVGAALTNRPFLRSKGSMAVSLSALETASLERRVRALCADPPSIRAKKLIAGTHRLTDPPWGSGSSYGGELDAARNPHRVDQGRAELHAAVLRQLAQTGDDDYAGALDQVLAQAASGVLTLSAAALAGTGIGAAPPPDPAKDPRYLDTVKSLAHRRDPDATPDPGTGVGRRSESLERRHAALVQLAQACGETVQETIDRLAREG